MNKKAIVEITADEVRRLRLSGNTIEAQAMHNNYLKELKEVKKQELKNIRAREKIVREFVRQQTLDPN